MLPLANTRVIEFAGLAPGPFAGLVLADWGADVVRIDRVNQSRSQDVLFRGKRSIALDFKVASGKEALLRLLANADVLIDPFRPGVLEKAGLGPDTFLGPDGLNKRLVYARLAGFPPAGPQGHMAGHDINYLASSGLLSMLPGTAERPSFPLNIVADFAGGGLTCATGILLALLQRAQSGRGQVVSTDMVSGTRYLSSFALMRNASGLLAGPRGTNILDGGAPFYDVYTCADGQWMAVGCIERQFYSLFLENFKKGVPDEFAVEGYSPAPEKQMDVGEWPLLKQYITEGFKTKPRDHWAKIFEGTDSCANPVLTPSEAEVASGSSVPARHPELSDAPQPDPSGDATGASLHPGQHTDAILAELGMSAEDRLKLAADGALGTRARNASGISAKI